MLMALPAQAKIAPPRSWSARIAGPQPRFSSAKMLSLAHPELLFGLLASAEVMLAASGDAVVLYPTYGVQADR
jgi:hypothetical protein